MTCVTCSESPRYEFNSCYARFLNVFHPSDWHSRKGTPGQSSIRRESSRLMLTSGADVRSWTFPSAAVLPAPAGATSITRRWCSPAAGPIFRMKLTASGPLSYQPSPPDLAELSPTPPYYSIHVWPHRLSRNSAEIFGFRSSYSNVPLTMTSPSSMRSRPLAATWRRRYSPSNTSTSPSHPGRRRPFFGSFR